MHNQMHSQCNINLDAIAHNYRVLSQKTPCAAVVKADAYGLGAKQISEHLYKQGCRHFFVAYLSEALELRPSLPLDATIFVLYGIKTKEDFKYCIEHHLTPVINREADAYIYECVAVETGQTYPYALHVETGMNRLSMPSSETENFDPKDYPHLKMTLLMSHLASADMQDHPQNKQQLERFQKIRQRFPHVPASLANSCGIFLGTDYHFDLLRPGIALYGLAHAQQFPELKNCVHVRSKIIHIQDYQAGETLSYGATYRVEKPMRIAILAIGYADGLPADLSGRGWMVGIADDFAPIVGRITMDLTLADVTHISCVEEEQWAYIVDDTHDFLKMSTQCARLPYELLIALGKRLQRSYSNLQTLSKWLRKCLS